MKWTFQAIVKEYARAILRTRNSLLLDWRTNKRRVADEQVIYRVMLVINHNRLGSGLDLRMMDAIMSGNLK